MAFNPNEVLIDRVIELLFSDKADGSLLARLTQLEESSLQTTTESEDVVDAIGSIISTLYRAKTATYTASNSLFSLDLLGMQYGSGKEVAETGKAIVAKRSEVLTAEEDKLTLSKTPAGDVKFIYKMAEGDISQKFTLGSASPTEGTFTINGAEITLPTGTEGKFFVMYDYESTSAIKISNKTDAFPAVVKTDIKVLFKDKCNENIKYLGFIHAENSQLDPADVTTALTATGKHPFTVKFLKPYCDEDASLFDIVVAQD